MSEPCRNFLHAGSCYIGTDGQVHCFACEDKSAQSMLPANLRQEGGDHYAKFGALQHWDVVAHFNLDYFQGQITKYVMRWKDKNGLEDLKKAQHFLEKYIELTQAAQAGTYKKNP